jgi:hypothetical protein
MWGPDDLRGDGSDILPFTVINRQTFVESESNLSSPKASTFPRPQDKELAAANSRDPGDDAIEA